MIKLITRISKAYLSDHWHDLQLDIIFNNTFHILGANMRSWKKNRFDILQKMYKGKDVKQIAKRGRIIRSSVYKNINAGTLEAIWELTDTISETIDERF